MLREGGIGELIKLVKYGNGEAGRMDNSGFIDLGKLNAWLADINKIGKPFCQRGDLNFELNREHAHIIWRNNYSQPRTLPFTPPPTVPLRNSQPCTPGNVLMNGPTQRPKLPGLISLRVFMNKFFAFCCIRGVLVNIIFKRHSTNAQRLQAQHIRLRY